MDLATNYWEYKNIKIVQDKNGNRHVKRLDGKPLNEVGLTKEQIKEWRRRNPKETFRPYTRKRKPGEALIEVEDKEKEIRKLVADGLTITDIVSKLGVRYETLRVWLISQGLHKERKRERRCTQ